MRDSFGVETKREDLVVVGVPYIRDDTGVAVGIVQEAGDDFVRVVYFSNGNKPRMRGMTTPEFIRLNPSMVPTGLAAKLWLTAFGTNG